MDQLVSQFSTFISEAIDIASKSSLDFFENKTFENVVICGMGGSGIGGKMVVELFRNFSPVPLVLVQEYDLPAFVNEKTLVIGSSYSGSTEETLSAIQLAKERNATVIGISSGGELLEFCKENGYNFIQVPGGNPPRSMLAFSLIQLIYVLSQASLVSKDFFAELNDCKKLIEQELENIQATAQQFAQLFYTKQGIIYTHASNEAIAIRARQQINENAKQLIWHHVVPEMNHNEIVGWRTGNNDFAVVFLVSQFLSQRNRLRIEVCQEIITKKTSHILSIIGKGTSLLQELFYFIHIVDWASVYLSKFNEQDSLEVLEIDYLKQRLDEF